MSGDPSGPETFPGMEWYEPPQLTAAPTATVLGGELTDEERAELEARERRRRELGGFGFGRVLKS